MSEFKFTNADLIGTWQLISWEIAYDDTRPSLYPYGNDAVGLLCYTADGYMNASIAQKLRPTMSSQSLRSAPEHEQISAFESYFNYAGPYQVIQNEVYHTVQMSLNPNMVGHTHQRKISMTTKNQLCLSACETTPGTNSSRNHRLIWQRIG